MQCMHADDDVIRGKDTRTGTFGILPVSLTIGIPSLEMILYNMDTISSDRHDFYIFKLYQCDAQ